MKTQSGAALNVLVRGDRFSDFSLRGDLFGGLTTAVVSLPMALAFGVASGAGPQAGLYGAILVGFFVKSPNLTQNLIFIFLLYHL